MREIHGPPKLPEGYRLDLSADPDAPALRRPDGTVVARFGARRSKTCCARAGSQEECNPSPPRVPLDHDSPNDFAESLFHALR